MSRRTPCVSLGAYKRGAPKRVRDNITLMLPCPSAMLECLLMLLVLQCNANIT